MTNRPHSPASPLAGMTIILGVTGSIAAYKAADLASQLHHLGAIVRPVLTAGAQRFISPLTFQSVTHQAVMSDLWDEQTPASVAHVSAADSADLLIVAPATANILAQFAHGLAADFLTTLYLVNRAPVLLAPAMNGRMWHHPATQTNVSALRERGHVFIGPEDGMQACGYTGTGRLAAIPEIIAAAARAVATDISPMKR